jgi:hypothetical protein
VLIVSQAWNRLPQRMHTTFGSGSHVISSPAWTTWLAISASSAWFMPPDSSPPPSRPKTSPPIRMPNPPAAIATPVGVSPDNLTIASPLAGIVARNVRRKGPIGLSSDSPLLVPKPTYVSVDTRRGLTHFTPAGTGGLAGCY